MTVSSCRIGGKFCNLRQSPGQDAVDDGGCDVVLLGLMLNDLQTLGEIFGEIATAEVGHIAASNLLHGGLDALECLNRPQLVR